MRRYSVIARPYTDLTLGKLSSQLYGGQYCQRTREAPGPVVHAPVRSVDGGNPNMPSWEGYFHRGAQKRIFRSIAASRLHHYES